MYRLHEIGHVVVKLAEVENVSVRRVGTMPAQVGNVNRNSLLQQRLRHAMHVVAAPRRAVNQDGHLRVSPLYRR